MIFDVIGLFGVAIIVIVYFLLQTDGLDPKGWRYSSLNLGGSILILVSLSNTFNLSSFVIEIIWIMISLLGLWNVMRRRHLNASERQDKK